MCVIVVRDVYGVNSTLNVPPIIPYSEPDLCCGLACVVRVAEPLPVGWIPEQNADVTVRDDVIELRGERVCLWRTLHTIRMICEVA